jgi:hypothetical protein
LIYRVGAPSVRAVDLARGGLDDRNVREVVLFPSEVYARGRDTQLMLSQIASLEAMLVTQKRLRVPTGDAFFGAA